MQTQALHGNTLWCTSTHALPSRLSLLPQLLWGQQCETDTGTIGVVLPLSRLPLPIPLTTGTGGSYQEERTAAALLKIHGHCSACECTQTAAWVQSGTGLGGFGMLFWGFVYRRKVWCGWKRLFVWCYITSSDQCVYRSIDTLKKMNLCFSWPIHFNHVAWQIHVFLSHKVLQLRIFFFLVSHILFLFIGLSVPIDQKTPSSQRSLCSLGDRAIHFGCVKTVPELSLFLCSDAHIFYSGVNHVSSLDNCRRVESFPPAVVSPPKAPVL